MEIDESFANKIIKSAASISKSKPYSPRSSKRQRETNKHTFYDLEDIDTRMDITKHTFADTFIDNPEDFLKNHLFDSFMSQNKSVRTDTIETINNKMAFDSLIDDFIARDLIVLEPSDKHGYAINRVTKEYVKYTRYKTNSFTICGSKEWIEQISNIVCSHLKLTQATLKWYYSPKGDYAEIPLTTEKLPLTEMYPFLDNHTIEEYFNKYIESSASVLILIGPPGTGKTTFIRGLLSYAKATAMVTYNLDLLSNDFIFANFIESEVSDYMVMEDCDNFLISREEGNDMMHRFLNVSDGLVTTTDKKMIFTTNLENVADIDPALLRPGRCFDVIEFRYLDREEAETLAKAANVELKQDKDKYSIADIFSPEQAIYNNTPKKKKMGFT